ncbi:MAG: hypothetical protein QNJ69_08355 [Gammaproteobacteria bacterium]|nr:hypothetical protein [Gammaproteobacteria bacterium]
MLLNKLQTCLEHIYEIPSQFKVQDFVIHDAMLAAQLDNSDNPRELPEKLLIHQNGENVDVALYLDEQILRRLEQLDPTAQLTNDNIHDFWVALEGISHFLYLTYHAFYKRAISLFELELQAEVDKYIMSAFLLGQQGTEAMPDSLHYHLYRNVDFDQRLQADELQRYVQANELAGKFATFIAYCINNRIASPKIINTLRRFYRLPQQQKIRDILSLDR